MKKSLFAIGTLMLIIVGMSFTLVITNELALGAKAPKGDVKMQDVSGKEFSLNDIKTDKGLLVIFSCNTCPYVKLSESRIKEYTDYCQTNGVGAILINSNEAQRDGDDSYDAMKKYYADQKLKVPYVLDKKSELADAFGASKTPQCFLFDKDGILIYKGAIDDNVKEPAAVKSFYLRDAIGAAMKGVKPAVGETKSIGCSIKRVE